MTYLQPFFLLMGRASAFWIGSVVLAGLSVFLVGVGRPNEITGPYVDGVFLAVFGFPAAAGWLAGAIIQEFQHCTFAWVLPGVNRRIAAGFLATGAVISVFVAALAVQSPANSQGFVTLVAVGLAGYCFGGDLYAPLGRWMSVVNLIVLAMVITRSRVLSGLAADYPPLAIAVSLGVATFGFLRLASRYRLRRRAFHPALPFPGRYSLERSERYERDKSVGKGARKTGWRSGYLGTKTWRWVRAVAQENYGPLSWQTVTRALRSMSGLGLLLVLYSWVDKGELGLGESLAKTVYQTLVNSPHVAPFGENGGPHPMVIFVIAAAGVMLTLRSPAALGATLIYPLSRRRRAVIIHRSGLVYAGVFFAGISSSFLIVGHLAGWLVGYPLRLDFIPYFFHALAATVILMPIAHWGGLRLRDAVLRKMENTHMAVIFGVIGFVVVVWIWSALVPKLLTPLAEIMVSALLFCVFQMIHREHLRKYYSAADFV